MRAHDTNKQSFVTISVDDGHPSDLKAAELLSKYGLAGTFYIPARNPEQPVLTASQIREVAQHFEIGGHGLNHVPLHTLSEAQAWKEISEGKRWMEEVLGQSVVSFCYPRGKFGFRGARLVKKAGFLGARTCMLNLHGFSSDPFMWGVSTQAHNHPRSIQLRHALLQRNFQGVFNFVTVYKFSTDWPSHFAHALNHVEAHGGVAHLYFHSWEMDDYGQWDRLESVLQSISQRSGLKRVTNGELFAMCSAQKHVLEVKEAGDLVR